MNFQPQLSPIPIQFAPIRDRDKNPKRQLIRKLQLVKSKSIIKLKEVPKQTELVPTDKKRAVSARREPTELSTIFKSAIISPSQYQTLSKADNSEKIYQKDCTDSE